EEFEGDYGIVGGVGKDGEAFFDEDASGFDGGLDVGEESFLVADDFDFDPIAEADFATETRGADGFVGGVATGGVGEQEKFLRIDEVEQRFLAAIEIDATDGDGDHFSAAGGDGAGGFVTALVFSGSNDETRREGAAGDD